MKYKILYESFISEMVDKNSRPLFSFTYKVRNKKEGYCVHHIIPRSLGGSDDPANLVYLTLEEHFHAHRLLAKFAGFKMIYAFNMMSISKDFRHMMSSKDLEFVKRNRKLLYTDEIRNHRSKMAKLQHKNMSNEKRMKRGQNISEGYKRWDEKTRIEFGKKISKRQKKPIIGIHLQTNDKIFYDSGKDAARDGFIPSKISECCNNKRDEHMNYKWSFVEENQ